MSAAEMHALEMAAMDDPFLADALEGYSKLRTNAEDDLAILKQQLAERTSNTKIITIKNAGNLRTHWWKVAAALILLAGAGTLMYRTAFKNNEPEALAKNEPAEQKPAASQPNPPAEHFDSSLQGNSESSTSSKTEYKLSKAPSGNLKLKPVSSGKKLFSAKADSINSTVNAIASSGEGAKAIDSRSLPAKPNIVNKDREQDQEKKMVAENSRVQGATQNAIYFNNFSGKVVDGENNAIPFATIKMNNA